jgi:hypothetical protein
MQIFYIVFRQTVLIKNQFILFIESNGLYETHKIALIKTEIADVRIRYS